MTTSPNLSSHQTLILHISQKNKILLHYQEHSDSILLKIPPYHHQKHQQLHVKLVTHIHYENEFEPLISVVFSIILQLGGLGPK